MIQYSEYMSDKLINSENFLKAWMEWLQHRREIKKKLTPLSAKKQLKLLDGFSPEIAVAMIDRSIIAGWQGIFELPTNHPLLQHEPLVDPDSYDGEGLKPIG